MLLVFTQLLSMSLPRQGPHTIRKRLSLCVSHHVVPSIPFSVPWVLLNKEILLDRGCGGGKTISQQSVHWIFFPAVKVGGFWEWLSRWFIDYFSRVRPKAPQLSVSVFQQPIPSRPLSLNATIETCFRDLCVRLRDLNDLPAQKPRPPD